MSPELRFVAQLNRLSRALEQAASQWLTRDLWPRSYHLVLLGAADDVRSAGVDQLRQMAERGSAKSAG